MSLGIEVQYPVAHTHTQNGLADSFIKHLQWIARPLLLRTKLPLSTWGHALLHAGNLIRLRLISDHDFSPLQIVSGSQPLGEDNLLPILQIVILMNLFSRH